ncbi:PHA-depolymerase-like protein [archaeon]|nr:MAG: PHA-depolymerase-like protein [archaeon]
MKIIQGPPAVEELIVQTNDYALLGQIDPVSHLRDDKVFLFSGQEDSVVNPHVVQALQKYYAAFLPAQNIQTEYSVRAEHLFPTVSYGEDCDTLGSPYIGRCGYDGAYHALSTLYGPLQPKTQALDSRLFSFFQAPFLPRDMASSLGQVGYIYVPLSCAGGMACHLHVSFHGCQQYVEAIGSTYAQHTGLNDWAESNGVIVLYPYATSSSALPLNPNGYAASPSVCFGAGLG